MAITEKSGRPSRDAEAAEPLQVLQSKNELTVQELQTFQTAAAACALRAEEYDLQENLDQAEYQYLQALKFNEQLFRITGAQTYADAAIESCTSLADICMQQGNMHGADYYHVQVLKYRQN